MAIGFKVTLYTHVVLIDRQDFRFCEYLQQGSFYVIFCNHGWIFKFLIFWSFGYFVHKETAGTSECLQKHILEFLLRFILDSWLCLTSVHPSFNQNIFLHIQLNCFLGHVQKGKGHYRHCICLTFAKEKILMLAWSTDRLLVQFFLCDLLTYQCGLYHCGFNSTGRGKGVHQ